MNTIYEIIALVIWGVFIVFSVIFILPLIITEISKKNVWIGTLAFLNFLNIIGVAPLYVLKEIMKKYFYLTEIFYTVLNGVDDFVNTNSIILFSVSLIEKFYIVYNPEQHEKIFSRENAVVIFLFCLYAASLSALKHVPWCTHIKENESYCLNEKNFTTPSTDTPFASDPIFFLLHSFLAFYLFMFAMVFIYYKIDKYFGLNKDYIKFLGFKICLIFVCKSIFILYRTITLFNKQTLMSERVENTLKAFGWGFTVYMLLEYLLENENFKKRCKKCYYSFCKRK